MRQPQNQRAFRPGALPDPATKSAYAAVIPKERSAEETAIVFGDFRSSQTLIVRSRDRNPNLPRTVRMFRCLIRLRTERGKEVLDILFDFLFV